MNRNIKNSKKIILSAALIIAAASSAFAQDNGLAGINEATSMVTSYFDPGTKLIYAIGAVVGLIGGVKVYGKFSSGDPDTSKTAASWFGKAQYLFIFVGGLLALFVLFVILYMVGTDQWICIGIGAAGASVLVWQTFALNARYGEHGLMKLGAARSHPRYLTNRRRIARLLKRKRKEDKI